MGRSLLLIDALINLVLGVLLLIYPQRLVDALGLPEVATRLYPTVLGGVLLGIGLALVITARGGQSGLGLDGAITINLCGAGVVVGWLVTTPHAFSGTGRLTLWLIATAVIGVALVEISHRAASLRRKR